MKEAKAQVHFYDGDTAACQVQILSQGAEGENDALWLWACFANRQLLNMGKDAPSLATLLCQVKGGLEELSDHDGAGPKLLESCPGVGKRRFEAHLVPLEEGFHFDLAMKGFGLLGKGLGFYCPSSVLLLLRHLCRTYRDHPGFTDYLEGLAEITGGTYLRSELNMRNANEKAFLNVLLAIDAARRSSK